MLYILVPILHMIIVAFWKRNLLIKLLDIVRIAHDKSNLKCGLCWWVWNLPYCPSKYKSIICVLKYFDLEG